MNILAKAEQAVVFITSLSSGEYLCILRARHHQLDGYTHFQCNLHKKLISTESQCRGNKNILTALLRLTLKCCEKLPQLLRNKLDSCLITNLLMTTYTNSERCLAHDITAIPNQSL